MSHKKHDHPRIFPSDVVHIAKAASLLREGRLVAFPTETVYGLGAHARDDAAVRGIYDAKGRPPGNPLIVHIAHLNDIADDIVWPDAANALAEHFWPGPLTLIVKRSAHCTLSPLVSAGGDTVGIRMPGHEVARSLLLTCGIPVAAPSANRSGHISPTQASHVAASLNTPPAMILDGGSCDVGLESTVLDVTTSPARILRPGSITFEMIQPFMHVVPYQTITEAIRPHPSLTDKTHGLSSPGLLSSHYAPGLPVRLDATYADPDEALIAFGPAPLTGAAQTLNLSAEGDLQEAAAGLFAALQALDDARFTGIAVMPIPNEGIGIAINDRLQRAAAPRDHHS